MSQYFECALPKSETSWLEGVQLKNEHTPDQRRELEQFKRELERIPEPNCGRIEELRDRIRKKTLITKESIEETAERIASVFFGKFRP